MCEVHHESQTHEQFGETLEELIRAVLKASGRGVPGGETELTLSQYFVMDAMADEALTVSEVARAARVAVPTATRALRALETRGFVDRERNDAEDRRLVTVALTAERPRRARREAHLGEGAPARDLRRAQRRPSSAP